MKYFSIDPQTFGAYLFLCWIFVFILIAIIHLYNKVNYKKISKLYISKFGSLPWKAAMNAQASLIVPPYGYYLKIDFLVYPFIFKYRKSILFYDMTHEQYLFIRSLPSNLTKWFLIEAFLLLTATVMLLILFALFYFYK